MTRKTMARRLEELKKKRIGVLMGGPSAERAISFKTGAAVVKALKGAGYKVTAIDAGTDLGERLKRRKIEVAFIALHGPLGEDGCVQGLLEVLRIPYTGSGVLSSALCMDKAAAKKVMRFHDVRTPEFRVVKGPADAKGVALPVIIKPVSEGSALGATIVKKKAELPRAVAKAKRFGGRVMAERFITGRELTVGVLDSKTLPVVEIRPKKGFYDFKAKYTRGMCEFLAPAPLDKAEEKRVASAALEAYDALGCRGAARVDLMLDSKGVVWVIEVNTVPGLTELSLLPMAARAGGLDYTALIERMLVCARLEHS